MKKKKFIIIAIVLIAAAVFFAIENKDLFFKSAERVSSGTIEATNTLIRSEVSGTVEEIFVEEGQKVQKDSPILRIDQEVLKLQVDQAEAQVSTLKEKLAELKDGARSQDLAKAGAAVSQIQTRIDKAVTVQNNAEKNYQRAQELLKDGGISEQEFERYENQYIQAEKDVEDLQAQMAQAGAQYDLLKEGNTEYTIRAMEANVKEAEARLAIQKNMYEKANVSSPVEGTVTSKLVEVGELVSQQRALVNISDLTDLWVMVYVPEKDLGLVSLNEKVEIILDAFPGEKFSGIITFISSEAEFTPLNTETEESDTDLVFAVKVKVADDVSRLRPGMTADVHYQ